jgi:hypothetical protein
MQRGGKTITFFTRTLSVSVVKFAYFSEGKEIVLTPRLHETDEEPKEKILAAIR